MAACARRSFTCPVDRQARRLDVGLPDVFTGVFWHVTLSQRTPAVEGPYSTPMVTSDRNAALSAPSRGQRPGSLLRLRFSASSALPWPSSLRRPSPSPGQRRIRFSTRRGPPPPPPPPLLLLPARPVLPASRAAAPAWAERRQIPPWARRSSNCACSGCRPAPRRSGSPAATAATAGARRCRRRPSARSSWRGSPSCPARRRTCSSIVHGRARAGGRTARTMPARGKARQGEGDAHGVRVREVARRSQGQAAEQLHAAPEADSNLCTGHFAQTTNRRSSCAQKPPRFAGLLVVSGRPLHSAPTAEGPLRRAESASASVDASGPSFSSLKF